MGNQDNHGRRHRQQRPPSPDAQPALPEFVPCELTPEQPVWAVFGDMPPQMSVSAHGHFNLEVAVVISGWHRRNHGAGWFRVGPGQAWVCGSLEPHYWLAGKVRTRFLLINCLPSLVTGMPSPDGFDLNHVFHSVARWGPVGSRRALRQSLLHLARQIVRRYGSAESRGQSYLDLLRVLPVLAGEVMEATGDSSPSGPRAARCDGVEPAIRLVTQSPGRRVSVAEAAHACHMTVRTFHRSFQRLMGVTFGQFALRSRLAEAAHALRAGEEPVKRIADRFGFKRLSHFTRAFKAHHKLTPARYRANTAAPHA